MKSHGINTKDDILGISTYCIQLLKFLPFICFKSKKLVDVFNEIIHFLIAPNSGPAILFYQRQEPYHL